jgi:pSer/pThr/pTyr-binding forkhead associated (FHA) protein
MMQLEFGGRRYPIAAGETVIGTAPGCAVVLAGDEVCPRHAVLHGSPAGAAIRAAAPEAGVSVNGVPLGSEPTPLLHGDKIRIGRHELLAIDPGRGGQTQLVSSPFHETDDAAAPSAPLPTGGRLVCLTDGREYAVRELLVLGRDAGADVVISGHEVSRRHAEILRTVEGYRLTDASVNGTYVNGVKVDRTSSLARGDVIRVGDEEFRFYADESAAAPAPEVAPPGAAYRLSDTMYGMAVYGMAVAPIPVSTPVTAAADSGKPLASLLVRSGEHKGRRLVIKAAAANIGRADYNDVVIADPSVSGDHAKLQRRDGLWLLTDSGSANGTYVDGELVTDEAPLLPGASVRFGDVTVLFEPHDDEMDAIPVGGTRVADRVVERGETPPVPLTPVSVAIDPPLIVDAPEASDESAGVEDVAMPTPARRPPRTPRPVPEPRQGMPGWLLAIIVAAAAAAGIGVGFVLLR